MNYTPDSNDELQVERIDADAVCEACGTVNPEDTLLCKVCGNNLRDQRSRRLSGGYDLDGAPSERRSLVGLRIGLVTLGILLFVAVGINLGNIEDLMLRAQTAEGGNLERFWVGVGSTRYTEMLRTMPRKQVTSDTIAQVLSNPVPGDTLDGWYLLMPQGANARTTPYGQVLVKTEGERIYFLVDLEDAGIEVRGEAGRETESRIACRGDASFRMRDQYFKASGFAMKLETGALACYAMTDFNEDRYGAAAYRLP